jgi:hypothetical protein
MESIDPGMKYPLPDPPKKPGWWARLMAALKTYLGDSG